MHIGATLWPLGGPEIDSAPAVRSDRKLSYQRVIQRYVPSVIGRKTEKLLRMSITWLVKRTIRQRYR
jgi:hypothetical protein